MEGRPHSHAAHHRRSLGPTGGRCARNTIGLSCTPMSSRPKMRVLGRHIVSDPRICHGKPTFRGTRVRVEDVLDQVASGMAWKTIIEEWNRSVTVEAIREAVQLASQALSKHADEFVLATQSA